MSSNSLSTVGALYPTFRESDASAGHSSLASQAELVELVEIEIEIPQAPASTAYGKKRPSQFRQSVNLFILITCLVLITLAADYHVMTSIVG